MRKIIAYMDFEILEDGTYLPTENLSFKKPTTIHVYPWYKTCKVEIKRIKKNAKKA